MVEQNGLLLVMMGVDPANEEDFNRWYEEEHIKERLSIPGFLKGTRYRAVVGEPKYLALYEVESTNVFSSPEYLKYYSGALETELTRRVVSKATSFTRNIYTKISEKTARSMTGRKQ
jgi:hypothetical protein